MEKISVKKASIIFIHAFVGWALCGAVIGLGRSVTSMENTLILHAVAVPIIFGIISLMYHVRFNFTKPPVTGMIFMIFAIALDAGLVAPLFEKSYDMFKSALGTWVPFGLIAVSTTVTGILVNRH